MKLVNYWDKYTEMYGQQNVKIQYISYLYYDRPNLYIPFFACKSNIQVTILLLKDNTNNYIIGDVIYI